MEGVKADILPLLPFKLRRDDPSLVVVNMSPYLPEFELIPFFPAVMIETLPCLSTLSIILICPLLSTIFSECTESDETEAFCFGED